MRRKGLLEKGSIMGYENVGALVITIGFGGILYCNQNRERPKPYSN